MTEKDPINPEKRKAEFQPLAVVHEDSNGQKTAPQVNQEKINTWLRHAHKIFGSTKGATIMVTDRTIFCLMSQDKEKIEAIVDVCNTIEAKRKEKTTQPII